MKAKIHKILSDGQPRKARELALLLSVEPTSVNQVLYRHTNIFSKGDDHRWTLAAPSEVVIEFQNTEWLECDQFEDALCSVESPLESSAAVVVLRLQPDTKVMLDAIARLLALCNQLVVVGKTVVLDLSGCKNTSSYLDRLGFYEHLMPEVQVLPQRPVSSRAAAYRGQSNRLVELAAISVDEPDEDIPDRLQQVLEQQYENNTPVGLHTILTELFSNVHEHSQSKLPGFAALQLYKGRKPHIRTVFSDSGKGILATIKPALTKTLRTELGAEMDGMSPDLGIALIERLFTKGGISRFRKGGRGLGLRNTGRFADKFDGSITVRQDTYEVNIHFGGDDYESWSRTGLHKLDGTHICVKFGLTRWLKPR
ncbi:ATP-binding region, ATPase-like protein [Cupriavidus taiwanensis]|uniref:ATP-binding protein n=1 Tax=Cupriavidus taiwanensis TaxID=164546 RepID=UPI000E1A1757|nr:ATP-binding protein [Cupriavidus taiwanensis]SPA28041.1 ATP-binding region, ATPase-like protein [Cupriavidus taiwanensis]